MIYFVFGYDEEILGDLGVGGIMDYFVKKGVELEFFFDEGLVIFEGVIVGVKCLIVSINVVEKGYFIFEFIVWVEGGYLFVLGKEIVVIILVYVIIVFYENLFLVCIDGIQVEMFDELVVEMLFFNWMVMVNMWLFGGVVWDILEVLFEINVMICIIIVLIMFKGSFKENVLLIEVMVIINFCVYLWDFVEKVIVYVEQVIDDDCIEICKLNGNEFFFILSIKSVLY